MFSYKDNQRHVSPPKTLNKTKYKCQKKEKVEHENSVKIQ